MNTISKISRDEIVLSLRRLQPRLRERGISRLAIFGSRARGNPRPDSDLDVLVDVKPEAKFSLIDLVGISHIISDELGLPANMFMRRSLEPGLANTIRSEIIEVFND
ncbi:nucleotidyltransferase domain-containing protein [Nitrobacter sp. NHB1]|uniref:nucleotidyltransferase family protein n=1 Tax=Nitrobacter sp. NHB1 TaxID=3119830 RepID=UPI002FFDADC0